MQSLVIVVAAKKAGMRREVTRHFAVLLAVGRG